MPKQTDYKGKNSEQKQTQAFWRRAKKVARRLLLALVTPPASIAARPAGQGASTKDNMMLCPLMPTRYQSYGRPHWW